MANGTEPCVSLDNCMTAYKQKKKKKKDREEAKLDK